MLLFIDIETNSFINADESALKRLGYSIEELCNLYPFNLNLHFFIENNNIYINGEKFSIDKPFETNRNLKAKNGSLVSCKITGKIENFEDKQIINLVLRELSKSQRRIDSKRIKYLRTLR